MPPYRACTQSVAIASARAMQAKAEKAIQALKAKTRPHKTHPKQKDRVKAVAMRREDVLAEALAAACRTQEALRAAQAVDAEIKKRRAANKINQRKPSKGLQYTATEIESAAQELETESRASLENAALPDLFVQPAAMPIQVIPPTPKLAHVQPGEVYAAMLASASRAPRESAAQVRLVDRTQTSSLHEHYDVMRNDGRKLRASPQLLVCFYDLTVPDATDVLGIPIRTMKHLRKWCGLTRWPRATLLANVHPVLTLKAVRSERLNVMRWAFEAGQDFIYGLLYEAHVKAGCSVQGLPVPETLTPIEPCAEQVQETPVQQPQAPQPQPVQPPQPQAPQPPLYLDDFCEQLPEHSSELSDEIDWDSLFSGPGPAQSTDGDCSL